MERRFEPGYEAAYKATYGAETRADSIDTADMGPADYEAAHTPLPAAYRSRVRQTRNPRGSEPHR